MKKTIGKLKQVVAMLLVAFMLVGNIQNIVMGNYVMYTEDVVIKNPIRNEVDAQ